MMPWVLLVGRVLFGSFFIINGLNHFVNVAALSAAAAEHGVNRPEVAVVGTGVLLLLGGLSVLLGVAPRVGLGLLILFFLPVTFMMHAFWMLPEGPQRIEQVNSFLRNLALMGASLALVALPLPWPLALDEPLRRRWPKWIDYTDLRVHEHAPEY